MTVGSTQAGWGCSPSVHDFFLADLKPRETRAFLEQSNLVSTKRIGVIDSPVGYFSSNHWHCCISKHHNLLLKLTSMFYSMILLYSVVACWEIWHYYGWYVLLYNYFILKLVFKSFESDNLIIVSFIQMPHDKLCVISTGWVDLCL